MPKSILETLWFRGICGLLLAGCIVVRVLEGIGFPWNAIRFARAYAFAHGFDLYTPADSGVIAGLIYGPIGYFLYAPAALWATPLPAIGTACLISALATLGPAALFLFDRRYSRGATIWALPVFTVLVLHFYASSATVGVWAIHTDAAGLGLTCLALYFTLRHDSENAFSWNLAAAASCAALAVWAKQTTAPILIVPAVYLFVVGRRGGAVWVLGLSAAIAGLLGVVFGAVYGFEDLLLTVFQVPSGHPLFPGAPLMEWPLVTEFMEILYLLAAVIVGSIILGPGSEPATAGRPPLVSRWSRLVPDWSGWPLLCVMGVAFLPMALLGRMKLSGQANNFGLTDYFLALGIGLLFLRLAARSEFRQGAGRRALEAVLLLLLAALGVRTVASFGMTGDLIAKRGTPAIQTAFEYAGEHRGEVYFPWHPLAALMAEGRYDHTAWGVLERESAGFPVSEAHLRGALPPNLQRLAIIDEFLLEQAIRLRTWDHFVLQMLPEFRCVVAVPELPGWTVVERGPESCASSAVVETRGE